MSEAKKLLVLNLFPFKAIENSKELELVRSTVTILTLIEKKCHKILISNQLKRLYLQRLKQIEKRMKGKKEGNIEIYILRLIKSLIFNKDKVKEVTEDISIPPNLKLTEDDAPLVKTACRVGNSIIITGDIDDFRNNEIVKKFLQEHGVKVYSIEEAIEKL